MNLSEFFSSHPKAALAFSGGVDSAYLLYAAKQNHCDLHAYFVKSPFQPEFEQEDAQKLVNQLGVTMTVLRYRVLENERVAQNDADRCYHCKRALFTKIAETALADGYTLLLDGTNASDSSEDRPGMRALQELKVVSPLRECGLTKAEIRRLSREAGLFTHNKPAYACLATRIPTGTRITEDQLTRVEAAENALFAMGFTDFRVRVLGQAAKLQFPAYQLDRVMECRERIVSALEQDFSEILLDLHTRPSETTEPVIKE